MKTLLLIISPFITSIAICQPYIEISSGSQTDCIGDSISLQAKNGSILYSANWTINNYDASGNFINQNTYLNLNTINISHTYATQYVSAYIPSLGQGANLVIYGESPVGPTAGIVGPQEVCTTAILNNYSIPPAINATSYSWNIPTASTIVGGSTSNTLGLVYGGANLPIYSNLTVSGVNTCGAGPSSSIPITVYGDPSGINPGSISGPNTVCQGETVTYSISGDSRFTDYVWTLPNGATGIINGFDLEVTFSPSAVSGFIGVQGSNPCGFSGTFSDLYINVNPLPDTASVIIGSSLICESTGTQTYEVPIIGNTNTYLWTLPSGASGTSNTNIINIDFTNGPGGIISVEGINSCGNGASSSINVEVHSPITDYGIITGPDSICLGSVANFQTSIINNAQDYIWTIPAGASGISNTTSISPTFQVAGVNAPITVQGSNYCGLGPVDTLIVWVNDVPGNAGSISSSQMVGSTVWLCPGGTTVTNLQIDSIEFANSYNWLIWPVGLPQIDTVTSSNEITIDLNDFPDGAIVSVCGINECGIGSYSTAITVGVGQVADPQYIDGNDTLCLTSDGFEMYICEYMPSADSVIWSVPPGFSIIGSGVNTLQVLIPQGTASGIIEVTGYNMCGAGPTVSLPITIGTSNTGVDVQSSCDAFTWIDGNTYTANNNSATYILTNASGCDSLVTLNLTLGTSNTGVDVQSACHSYTWIDGNTYTTNNSIATYTLTNISGCDSLVTLNLTMGITNPGIDIQTACDNFTWIDGNTYTTSNNSATHTLTSIGGCDSLVTLNLTINTVNNAITQDGIVLTADESGATYQWLNCPGMDQINGATNQSYSATTNGDYAVIVSDNGCTDTSLCYSITTVSINEYNFSNELRIFPNPTSDFLFISTNDIIENVQIFDMNGRVVLEKEYFNVANVKLDISILQNGFYTVLINKTSRQKIIKN
jgi:hypothetical protein